MDDQAVFYWEIYLQLPQVVSHNDECVECGRQLRVSGLNPTLFAANEPLHKSVHGFNDRRADVLGQLLQLGRLLHLDEI